MLDYLSMAAHLWEPAAPRYHKCREGGPAPDQPSARMVKIYAQMPRLTEVEVTKYYADNHAMNQDTEFIPSETATLDAVAMDRIVGSHEDEPIKIQSSSQSKIVVGHRTLTAEAMKQSLKCKEFDAVCQFTYSADFVKSIVKNLCSTDRLPAMSPEDFNALRHWVLLGRETADAEIKHLLNEYWNSLLQLNADFGTSTPVKLASNTSLKVDLRSVKQPASCIARLVWKRASAIEANSPNRAATMKSAARVLAFLEGELKKKSARIRNIVKENRMLKERLETQTATEVQENPACRKRRRVQAHEADTDKTAAGSSKQSIESGQRTRDAMPVSVPGHFPNDAQYQERTLASVSLLSIWLHSSLEDSLDYLGGVETMSLALRRLVKAVADPELQKATNALVFWRNDVLMERPESQDGCRDYLKAWDTVFLRALQLHYGRSLAARLQWMVAQERSMRSRVARGQEESASNRELIYRDQKGLNKLRMTVGEFGIHDEARFCPTAQKSLGAASQGKQLMKLNFRKHGKELDEFSKLLDTRVPADE
ncbi:hypothetical protein LIA77_01052 [Sarocladium implicatum]|nr:hypothetical protein LIA77_01052 [Sarocladium implicatum]